MAKFATVSLLVLIIAINAINAFVTTTEEVPSTSVPTTIKSTSPTTTTRRSTTQRLPEVCANTNTCGWLVYDKTTRNEEYFMKNTCRCADGWSCEHYEDNVGLSAYAYRCKIQDSKS